MSSVEAVALLCAEVGLAEPPGWVAFFELVQSWDARTDLTSARSEVELAEVLFLDAAHLLQGGWTDGVRTLVDVGAGVGAPTIPLIIAQPSLRAVLVEPRRIRAAFLRTASGSLGLPSRLVVREQRLDPAKPTLPDAPFDVALSRATFGPDRWLEIGAQLANEIWVFAAGGEITPPPSLRLVRQVRYTVPSSGAPRALLAFRR